MADNQILLSFGVDEKTLDKAVNQVLRAFKAGLKDAFKDLNITLPKIDVSKIQLKGRIDLSEINTKGFIYVPIDKIRFTGGSVDLSKINVKGAINANVNATGTSTTPASQAPIFPTLSHLTINPNEITKARQAIVDYQTALRTSGATEQEAKKQTQELNTALNNVARGFHNVEIAIRARVAAGGSGIPTEREIEQLGRLQVKLDDVTKNTQKFSVEQAKQNILTERGTRFMESFGFKVGILGFGLGILGGNLQRLTQNIVNFVTNSAKAVEPLERVTNLITQLVEAGQIQPGQKKFVLDEINRLADLPGSNLDAITKSFQKFLTVGLSVIDTIKLLEGITKATARSGTGAAGAGQVLTQLQQFATSETGQLTARDVRSLTEQGGRDISNIIAKLGGAEGITKLGPTNFFQQLIQELGKVPQPLVATEDLINRIYNSGLRIKNDLLDILKPGLEDLVNTFKTIEGIVSGLKDGFDSLSPRLKKFIGDTAITITAITGALSVILTILAAVGISLASGFHLLEALGLTLGELSVGVGRIFAGFVEFVPILNVVVALLIAYYTNLGNFADRVNEGFKDLFKSFEKLYDSIGKLLNTKGVNSLIEAFKFLFSIAYDTLTQVVGVVGSAIGGILGSLGDVVDLIAGIIEAFSANTFSEAIQKIGDAINTYMLHGLQRVLKVLIDIASGFVNVIGKAMVKFGLIQQETLDTVTNTLEEWKKKYGDTNAEIKNGTLVLKEHKDAVNSDSEAIDKNIDALREQEKAFDDLAKAASKAKDEMAKAQAKASEAEIDAQIKQVKDDIQRLGEAYRQQLETEFDPEKLGGKLQELTAKLNVKRRSLLALEARKSDEQMLVAIKALDNDPLKQKVTAALTQLYNIGDDQVADSVVEANQAVVNMMAAKTYDIARKSYDVYAKNIQAILGKKDFILQHTTLKVDELDALNSFARLLFSKTKEIQSDFTSTKIGDEKSVDDTIEQARKATNARHDFLVRRHEDNQLQVTVENEEEKIKKRQAENAALDVRVSNFELTASQARLLKAQNDKEIARIQRDIDKAKIQKDLDILRQNTPGDIDSIQQKQRALDSIDRQFNETSSRIDDKLREETADSLRKVEDASHKRLESSVQDILKIIEPFNDVIFRVFALARQGAGDAATSLFKGIRTEMEGIAGSVPEVQSFLESLDITLTDIITGKQSNLKQGFDPNNPLKGLTDAFINFKSGALAQKFAGELISLRRQIQAILLSEAFAADESGQVTKTKENEFLFSLLGFPVSITSASTEEIKAKLQEAGLDRLIKISREIISESSILNSKEEVEAMQTVLAQAKSTQAEINAISQDGARIVQKAFDEAFSRVVTDKLDFQLSETAAKIAKIDADNARRGIVADQDLKRQLLVQQATLNFQKEDLNLQMRAREEAREKINADRQTEIFKKLQEDRVKLFLDAEKQILEITGGDASKLPSLKPLNLPGEEGTAPKPTTPKKTDSFLDILRGNLGDTKGLDTFTKKITRLAEALNATFEAARKARQAIADLVGYVTSGDLLLDTFQAWLDGNATSLELFSNTLLTIGVQAITAFGEAWIKFIESGEDIFKSFKEFLGSMLITVGEALIRASLAAVAAAFVYGTLKGGFLVGLAEAAAAAPGAAVGVALGTGLVVLGQLLGGKGSYSPATTANTNTANATNAQAGATGTGFDPNKDPKTAFQKALSAQILIDIRTDSGQIVKTVIKEINGNGRLATLIGNRKLQFGY